MGPVHCCFAVILMFLDVRIAAATVDVSAQVDTDTVIHITDKRYLSVVMGPTVLRHNWGTFNVSSPRVRTLAMGLAPAIFRVGGNEADLLVFNRTAADGDVPGDFEPDNPPLYDFADYGLDDDYYDSEYSSTEYLEHHHHHHHHPDPKEHFFMSAKQWDTLNTFTRDVGWNLLFDLNVLLRQGADWDPNNALDLIKYSIEKNYTYNLNFELGNEPNAFKHYLNRTLDPAQLGKDFLHLHFIMRQSPTFKQYFSNSLLVGPDTTKPRRSTSTVLHYLKTFLTVAGESLSAITWHQYYINGSAAKASDFIDPAVLNLLPLELERVKAVIKSVGLENKPLMLGETGSCWGGGAPNLSNRYAGGFLWLDKLGIAAQTGHSVVMRQTFYEGNYGLLDTDLNPTPDYWLSLFYKVLVGREVFGTSVSDTTGKLRFYAHCTGTERTQYSKGAVTVYALNLYQDSVNLNLASSFASQTKHVYWFLPSTPGNFSADFVSVNGQVLRMPTDTSFPAVQPAVLETPEVVLPPTSFGFIVIPNAAVGECMH